MSIPVSPFTPPLTSHVHLVTVGLFLLPAHRRRSSSHQIKRHASGSIDTYVVSCAGLESPLPVQTLFLSYGVNCGPHEMH